MIVGAIKNMVLLGVVLCGVFAGATYFGGWTGYAIGVAVGLVAIGLVVLIQSRIDKRTARAVSTAIEDGDTSELAAVMGGSADGRSLVESIGNTTETLRRTEFMEGALKGLGNPALACDIDGKIVMATTAMLDLLKKPNDKVMGYSVSQAFYNKEGVSISERAIQEKKGFDDVVDIAFWDGRTVPIRLFTSLIYDGDGEILGAISSFVDLTDQVEQQRVVEEQTERMLSVGEQISGLAEHVASATELLSASADEQAQGARKQRTQTASVATAMEEMTATVIEVAQNATGTSDAAAEAQESANEGVSMVSKAVDAINQVAESASLLETEVGELNSQADEIGRIISVINDIADQTNLLALNAAIEAARAGDAGRGFAVVADEVRKLAEKTMDATREVEEAIGMIQERSRHATSSMQQTAKQVGESTDLSNKAGEALQHIMESIEDMVGRVAQIATAAEQQSASAEEINQNIEDIASIAEDTDEAAGQAAGATREMADLARELLAVSKDFKGTGDVKLRASEGEMKGVLPKLCQGYVQQQFGDEVYQDMQTDMGEPVFLPADSYPDQVLMQMAEIVSTRMGLSLRDFFLGLGRYTVIKFNEMYPGYFKDEPLKDFYLRMNDVHAQLTKDNPGIKPPKFTYEDKGDGLFMNYKSSRGLFDYFEGILLGAADFKGEEVSISVKPFDDETARAEIVFLGKA